MPTLEALRSYWSPNEVWVNLLLFANILGALLLGLVAGYERTYHGRAAGMRTYGLVCMASCALTIFPATRSTGSAARMRPGSAPTSRPTRRGWCRASSPASASWAPA
ncbi:MAG: MgtC/SapB family protein [Inhella sp.]